MSLFQYFTRREPLDQSSSSFTEDTPIYLHLPSSALGVSDVELININEVLGVGTMKTQGRTKYTDKQKREIARYANMHGCTKAIKTFNKQFPKLTEGTVRLSLKNYCPQKYCCPISLWGMGHLPIPLRMLCLILVIAEIHSCYFLLTSSRSYINVILQHIVFLMIL